MKPRYMTSPADHFRSPRTVLKRARENIRALEQQINIFLKDAPQHASNETDPKTGEYVRKIRLNAKLPDDLSAIAHDIASGLRSVLDQVVYASTVAINGGDPRKTEFAFGKTRTDVENKLKSDSCKDVPTEIRALILSFEPHEQGNAMLWTLNKLRNTQIHKMLVPFGIKSGGLSLAINPNQFGQMNLHLKQMGGTDIWDADKQELTVARFSSRPQADIKYGATFNVALDALSKEPAVAVFDRLAGEIERILLAFEAETARIVRQRKP